MHLKLGLYEARNNEVAIAASLFRFTVKHPKQQGFSLIELMIVVAIIGILAAIAIPAYSAYRENAFNTTALHDLHNVMVAEEAEFASNHAYKSIASGIGPAWIFGGTKFVSKDVGYIINIDAGKQQFAAFSGHAQGSNVYAGDFNGTHEIRTSATPDADAQTQIVSILSGWGSPL